MKNTIEDPLCMNYNSAGVLMSNKDIPKELRSVSLVDLSVAVELQEEAKRMRQFWNDLKLPLQQARIELAEQKKITEDLVEVLKKIEKMETMSIAKLTTSLALTKYNESIKK